MEKDGALAPQSTAPPGPDTVVPQPRLQQPEASPAVPVWRRRLGADPEAALRAVFALLLGLTVAVLGWDLIERMRAPAPPPVETALPGERPRIEPFLPSIRREVDPTRTGGPARAPEERLREAMTIELGPQGRLEMTGTIVPGTAERVRAELEKRGGYATQIVLNSPGGVVQEALAMARLVRGRGLDSRVAAGGLCASSCPLLFAGGVRRVAEPGAAIGVHQVFAVPGAVTGGTGEAGAGAGMARAQAVSAEVQRHLLAMGVDARVWIHAMETPPQELFYFSPAELRELKLVTADAATDAAAAEAAPAPRPAARPR